MILFVAIRCIDPTKMQKPPCQMPFEPSLRSEQRNAAMQFRFLHQVRSLIVFARKEDEFVSTEVRLFGTSDDHFSKTCEAALRIQYGVTFFLLSSGTLWNIVCARNLLRFGTPNALTFRFARTPRPDATQDAPSD